MARELQQDHAHKKYSKISYKKREILIELVIGKGESLTKTSKKLNIKLSTAKLILRKYRKTGALFNKNMSARPKKSERAENKQMQNAQQSRPYKQSQQLQNPQSAVKQEEQPEDLLPQGVPIPTVFYPAYQHSWLAYPWYNYAFHL